MKRLQVFSLVAIPMFAGAAWADDGPTVPLSSTATAECYAAASDADARRMCIGKSSNACMDAPGGSTTVGIGACLDDERGWWDAQLNVEYKHAMQLARTSDADMKQDGIDVPSQAEALKTMQRTWIAFRDQKCSYVASLWTNGTGAGPAYVGCLMDTTADQAIFLASNFN